METAEIFESEFLTETRDVRVFTANAAELCEWLGTTPFSYWRKSVFYKENGQPRRHEELILIDDNEPDFSGRVRNHIIEVERTRYGADYINCAMTRISGDEFHSLYCYGEAQAVVYDLRADGTAKSTAVAFGNGAYDY